jgi:glutathione peroxidase
MNSLVETFGDKLAVLGFPCNQFGKQHNNKDWETLDMLKNVRPGGGFEPKIDLFTRNDVNGADALAVYKYLKSALPFPVDDCGGLGGDYIIGEATWSPVMRGDVGWNFEKFLINQNGKPVARFSKKFPTSDIAPYIQKLLDEGADAELY